MAHKEQYGIVIVMIYIVEDDSGIRKLLSVALEGNGYAIKTFEDGKDVVSSACLDKPELILLDIMLPGKNGLDILSEIRSDKAISGTPVILVTAKDSEFDKVDGFDKGADDYISKPFSMLELLSRVKAVLRRTYGSHQTLKCGNIELSEKAHTVIVENKEIQLTLKEFELLKCLMENIGSVLSREMLLSTVWEYAYPGETRTVDVHIRHLREKLGDAGSIIETVKGVGYKIKG